MGRRVLAQHARARRLPHPAARLLRRGHQDVADWVSELRLAAAIERKVEGYALAPEKLVPGRGDALTSPVEAAAGMSSHDVLDLLGIEISPARLKCAMLSHDSLQHTLSDLGAAEPQATA